jgi:hypothetical protein
MVLLMLIFVSLLVNLSALWNVDFSLSSACKIVGIVNKATGNLNRRNLLFSSYSDFDITTLACCPYLIISSESVFTVHLKLSIQS